MAKLFVFLWGWCGGVFLLKNGEESLGHGGLEVEVFACDGVVEIETESVEAETAAGIVAIAVFYVAADGVTEVLKVDANLIFSARFKLQFHEAIALICAECMEVSDSIFASVVCRTAISEIGLVVLEPGFDGSCLLFHASGSKCDVATVGDDFAPVVLEDLFCFERLGVDEKTARVAVETMDDVGGTLLVAFVEIVVEYGLDTELVVVGGHGEDADVLLDDADVAVFIDELDELADELHAFFALGDFDCHSRTEGVVVLGNVLAVNADTATLKNGFRLGVADAVEALHDEVEKLCVFLDAEGGVL